MEYSADLLSLLANGRFDLQGRTPYELVMHHTPDISEYVSFRWFQWCWTLMSQLDQRNFADGLVLLTMLAGRSVLIYFYLILNSLADQQLYQLKLQISCLMI